MFNRTIVDLCAGTGAWSKPYLEAGYHVLRFTLPDHDVRDLRAHDLGNVYGVLASPPCTMFAKVGNAWYRSPAEIREAMSVVDACLRIIVATRPWFWCLENPVGKLVHYLGKPCMYMQPYNYGDDYSKQTCLWGCFNPPARRPVRKYRKNFVETVSGSSAQSLIRSITPGHFSRAFFKANQ